MARDWGEIRKAYLQGGRSLVALSQQFKVPIRTLERRCARDGWKRLLAANDGALTAAAAAAAVEEGTKLGLSASEFVNKTVKLTDRLLDELEFKIKQGGVSVSELRQLSSSLRELSATGREAFGLDEARGSFTLSIISPPRTLEIEIDAASVASLPVR